MPVEPTDPTEPAAGAALRPATTTVHAGRPAREPDAPLNPPLTLASTYVGGGEVEYGRYGNPTWKAFEDALGALEGGRALAFSSGLAAVSAVLDLVAADTFVVAPHEAYQGTLGQLADLELRGRARSKLVDIADTTAVLAALAEADEQGGAALLWIESPTNPGLGVADLPALVAAAHEVGAYVVVDNTFATPLRQRPLDLGADLVLHSVTKYLAGHADALLGAIVAPQPDPTGSTQDLWAVLKQRRDLTGATPGTMEAWLALRGMRTLALRVDRAEANARELVERLRAHPGVDAVRYPGFGGMITIEVAAGEPAADLVCRSTKLWVFATSLGGVESSLERRRRWRTEAPSIAPSLLRLSVGIEDVDDLWADLAQALDRVHPA